MLRRFSLVLSNFASIIVALTTFDLEPYIGTKFTINFADDDCTRSVSTDCFGKLAIQGMFVLLAWERKEGEEGMDEDGSVVVAIEICSNRSKIKENSPQ